MEDRACPECGEVKPPSGFWGKNRRIMEVCTSCRRRASRHERHVREYKKVVRKRLNLQMRGLLNEQRSMIKNERMASAVAEVDRIIRTVERAVEKYAEKVAYAEATKRTETALTYQSKRLAYFEDVKQLLLECARRGIERPLEHYLANTFLLNKHGFACTVKDADPWIEFDNEPQLATDTK